MFCLHFENTVFMPGRKITSFRYIYFFPHLSAFSSAIGIFLDLDSAAFFVWLFLLLRVQKY